MTFQSHLAVFRFLVCIIFYLSQFIMELTDGTGIGRICECSGVSQMVNTCFSYLRKGGRTVLIGLPKQPLHVENVLQDIGI